MTSPILVTGGTGTLGSHVVRGIRRQGCQARVLSRQELASTEGVEYVVGDLVKGTGVDAAVRGVDVIVHCASDKKGDVDATRNLVEAATAHGRQPHLVYISIVGAASVPFGYFQTKRAAERVVEESSLPWTIQRATQFYDFILNGAKSMTRLPIVPVPKDFRCQPIDPAEVAVKLVNLALSPPTGRVTDIAGPDTSTWAEMIRQYLTITKRRRVVLQVPMPKMKEIRAGCLLVGDDADRPYGRTTWDEFLTMRVG